MKFTENQQKAIDLSGTNLLVSAAAGSGKTAVLVERILKKVIQDKLNIDEFLVVTFTNLAASEMKEKIIKEIRNKIKISDGNSKEHLKKQLEIIHFAKINTVHAFCFDILREFFSELDILPDFKIISGTEATLVKKTIMEEVIADFFEKNNALDDEFVNFNAVINKKTIENEMLALYDYMFSYSRPYEVLDKSIDFNNIILQCNTEEDIEKMLYTEYFVGNSLKYLRKSEDLAQNTLKTLAISEELYNKNSNTIETDISIIRSLIGNLEENGYVFTYKMFETVKFPRLSPKPKGCDDDYIHEKIKELRGVYREIIKKKAFNIEPISMEQIKSEALFQLQNISYISEIIKKFDQKFEEIKRNKNILVFSDAEHKMIKLLENPEICENISSRFTEILIDEYQDTNEIQDTMFEKLATNDSNRFMVGDLKQSIYKFRFADPSIFTEKLDTYSADPLSETARKVCLNNNFRSKNDVIESVNEIFNRIMTRKMGGVDYNTNEQQLVFSADYFENDEKKTEVILVDKDSVNENLEKELATAEIEGRVIAEKINDMIAQKMQVLSADGYRDLMYKDIVILLRAVNSKAYFYKKAIENAGISVDFESDASNVFNTPEIMVLLSFLKIIDNKKDKISMISVIKSEIFGFSNNEILEIQTYTEKSFIYSIYAIVESENDGTLQKKCAKFIEILDEIIEYSKFNSVYFTLWHLINQLDIIAKFTLSNFGEIRRKNIKMFLDFVESFGDGSNLFEFLAYCENLDEKNTKLTQSINAQGSVKIMSIHKSKGLEFPVVFVADLAKKFNDLDKRADIVKNSNIGIATKHASHQGFVKYSSLIREIINKKNEDENISEEMRVLYVALTRPKEKLILVGCVSKLIDKTGESSKLSAWINGYFDANSYIDWILPTALKSKSAEILSDFSMDLANNIENDIYKLSFVRKLDDISAEIYKRQTPVQEIYEYNIETKIDVPSKVTASAVQAFNRLNERTQNEPVTYYKKPKFIAEITLTPAEKGIAHHFVMQFIDFSKCDSLDNITIELDRLLKQNFINDMQRQCIEPVKIYNFFKTEVGKRLLKSTIYREFNFSVLIDSVELLDTDSSGKVLFQGIIDCMFECDGYMNIIDFKTDAVKTMVDVKNATEHHKEQLFMYEKAVFEVFKMPVKRKLLYYFANEMFDEI